jgi:hypothetical protein
MLSIRHGSYGYVISYGCVCVCVCVCAALERRDDDGSEVAGGSHDVLIERRVCLRVKKSLESWRVLFVRIVRNLPETICRRGSAE